ncbi:unnamed protein product [Closterium sp. NIES-65]|nr:unnamed protein product [Closterium sp. NIES-65]
MQRKSYEAVTFQLLFALPFSAMAQVWDGMLSHLDLRRSFRVVLWDLMGAFSTPSTSYDFQRYASLCLHANDLLKVLDALGEAGGEGQGEGQGKVGPVKGWQGVEVENVVCVGHSVSGMVALLASLKCPSAPRVALYCSARRALLQPARHALLPCASRPTAARVSHSTAPRVVLCCSSHVAPCCPARRALRQPARRVVLPRASRLTAARTSHPAALHSACLAADNTQVEPRRPARAALPNPICPGARASAAAGGGAARSAGGAAA